MNHERKKYGLPAWELPQIGRNDEGEVEILGLYQVIDFLQSLFVVFYYRVLYPDGKEGILHCRSSTRPIALVFLELNGRFVFTHEHRPNVSHWVTEAIRGWTTGDDPEQRVMNLLKRKLGEAWVGTFRDTLIEKMGTRFEDTGERADEVHIYYVRATTDQPVPSKCGFRKIRSLSWDDVLDREQRGTFPKDLHTEAALALYKKRRASQE